MKPQKVLVLPEALSYMETQEIVERFKQSGIPITFLDSNRVSLPTSNTPRETFFAAKRVVVLAARKRDKFQGCRPSANYQLPLISGCPGHCQYCYLNTSFGLKPYIRLYVNQQEILTWAEEYVNQRRPFITIFEGAAISDPIPLEQWSGSLRKTIEYFGQHPFGRFRFVTKFDQVDSLLDADHRLHTRIRFTVNSQTVIQSWDKGTVSLHRRLQAAAKVAEAGYLYGFLVGPVIIHEGWETEYEKLFEQMASVLPPRTHKLASIEIVTHRFTPKAKEIIKTVYPDSDLDLNEESRQWKYGQFGYGKWVYPKDVVSQIETLFFNLANKYMPEAKIMYTV